MKGLKAPAHAYAKTEYIRICMYFSENRIHRIRVLQLWNRLLHRHHNTLSHLLIMNVTVQLFFVTVFTSVLYTCVFLYDK